MNKIKLFMPLNLLIVLIGCGQVSEKDLINAAYNGKTEVLENAIDAGANVNLKSKNGGVSLLSYAAGSGHGLTVYMLIKKGAKVNDQDDSGWSALHFAASKGHSDAINMLTKSNIELDAKTKDGWTALMYATFYNHERAVKSLLESGALTNISLENGLNASEIAKSKGFSNILNLLNDAVDS